MCSRRADGPWLQMHHYIFQLYRAYSQKQDLGFDSQKQLADLVHASDLRLREREPDTIWQIVDSLLDSFPWQASGFREFTSLARWRSNFKVSGIQVRQRLVVADPAQPGKLLPFKQNGKPNWFVMGGNRTHIDSLEWQDPVIFDEPLIEHAESALWKFLDTMSRLFKGSVLSEINLVGIVPSPVVSRWECRLENFCVSRFANWTHPRNASLADDLLAQYGDEIFAAASNNIFSAYSLGAVATEQLFSEIRRKCTTIPSKDLAESVYFGGYVDLSRLQDERNRTLVVSLLDECVFGSPDLPEDLLQAIEDKWFSSPFTLRPNPWGELSTDFDRLVAMNDGGCGWSTERQFSGNASLVLLAGQTSIPTDAGGEPMLSDSERMEGTRYGHFLHATVDEFLRTKIAGRLLSRFKHSWGLTNAIPSTASFDNHAQPMTRRGTI